ncbi:MAG TPA: CpsD/CapB family tyrosine-protein kinase, partial [Candidatus Limnocylindrales bacterium]|nr:CpsD/CapB family tyrosine-protein kinase [Candidatus Limnocylindrales bacterium]
MNRKKRTRPLVTTWNNPRSPVAEAFRTLRTNISYAAVDRQARKILITGADPDCGKSTITVNLGVALAQTGASVLLVDADLRKPYLHRFFNSSNEPGLTNLIFNEALDLEAVVQPIGLDSLYLLASGPIPPYPAELLASDKMKNLLGRLAERYEYVLIDSPPAIAVTDAAILAQLVDGTVFVVEHGMGTRDEVLVALEQLRKVNAHILGAVFNG